MVTRAVFLVIAGATLSAIAGFSEQHSAQHVDPGAFFTRTCSGCHVAPDPAFETERAWIGQVRETA